MENIGSLVGIISAVLLGLFILIIGINVLKSTLRGLKKSIGSLAAVMISAIIAAVLTVFLCSPDAGVVSGLQGVLTDSVGEVAEIFSIEAVSEAVAYYVSMLLSPFFFTLCFALISIILSIVIAIVIKFIPPHKKPGKLLNRLGGAGVGLVCGFLVAVILLSPIVGTIEVVAEAVNESHLAESLEDAEDGEDDEMTAVIVALTEDKTLKVLNAMGCGLLYNSLANAKVDGTTVYLKDDISVVMMLMSDISGLSGDVSDMTDEQLDALNRVVDDLDRSILIKRVVAGVFADASGKWIEGEQFIGMDKITAGDVIDPVIDEMLVIMSTTNEDYITGDLGTMVGVIEIMHDRGVLEASSDFELLLKKLGEGNVTSELIVFVSDYDRMASLSDEITKLSIRALASTLNVPLDNTENYANLMDEIAIALNSSMWLYGAERVDVVAEKISDSLEGYGILLEGDTGRYIANGLINDVGDEYTDASAVEEFFIVYNVAGNDQSASSGEGSEYEFLSAGSGFETNDEGKLCVGDRVLEHYTEENYSSSSAFMYAIEGIDFGDASVLDSPEHMGEVLVSVESILDDLTSFSECENVADEAAKLDEIVGELADVFAEFDADNKDAAELVCELGTLLDLMDTTRVFGHEVSGNILKAILQSPDVSKNLKLTTGECTSFANDLNALSLKEGKNYESLMLTVSRTINMVQDANSDKTEEEKTENTKELLVSMDRDTSDMLGNLVSGSLIENHGVQAEKSENVSTMVDNLFINMADYEGEDAEGEAQAVNMVMDFAMNDDHVDADNLFNNNEEGKEGSLNLSAKEFVAQVAESKVVSATVNETVQADGYSENPIVPTQLSEIERNEMKTALDEYYSENAESYFAEHGETEGLATTLNSIAIFFNIEHSVN